MPGSVRVGCGCGRPHIPLTFGDPISKAQIGKRPTPITATERRMADLMAQATNNIPEETIRAALAGNFEPYGLALQDAYRKVQPDLEQCYLDTYDDAAVKEAEALKIELRRLYREAGLLRKESVTPEYLIAGFRFDRTSPTARSYAQTSAARLVTNVTKEGVQTLREAVAKAYTVGATPNSLQQSLYKILNNQTVFAPSSSGAQTLATFYGVHAHGLTTRYENAVINRATQVAIGLEKRGITGTKALEEVKKKSQAYADKLRRQRSKTIARTELAFANNAGKQAAFDKTVADGLASKENSRKQWKTNRFDVCKICVPLHGTTVKLDEEFAGKYKHPPAHPNCRCTMNFVPNIKHYQAGQPTGLGTPESPAGLTQPQIPSGAPSLPSGPPTPPAPPTPTPTAPTAPVAPTPTPAPVAPTSGVPAGHRTVLDDLELPSTQGTRGGNKERLEIIHKTAEDLDARLIAPTNMETLRVTVGSGNKRLGGYFRPPRRDGTLAEIRAVLREGEGLGQIANSFAHEYGHRLDYQMGGESQLTTNIIEMLRRAEGSGLNAEMAEKYLRDVGEEVVTAVKEFMEAAKNTQSLKTLVARNLQNGNKAFAEYFSQPHEIFARAFAQWLAESTGDIQQLNAVRQLAIREYQFYDEEFEVLKPLVERILKARGLLKEVPVTPAQAIETAETLARTKRIKELTEELDDLRMFTNPIFAKMRELDEALNNERLADHLRDAYQKQYLKLKKELEFYLEESQSLSAEYMTLLHQDLPDVELDAARWANVSLSKEARVSGNDTGTDKWKRARDRYVVADTPTLEMNRALRGEIPMTPTLQRRVGEAKYLTSGTLDADVLLSRSMELTPEQAANFIPGSTWESKGFQSSQSGYKTPYNRSSKNVGTVHVSTTLRVPKGTAAGDVGYGEIVLRPGSWKVVSSKWNGSVLDVVMEWIG